MDDLLNRHDLTDEEWERLGPLMPAHPRQGHRWNDHRTVINGIFFRTRAGCPWRDLPPGFGNWSTVYGRHRRWSLDGTWAQILAALRAGCDEAEGADWMVSADSTVVRAHQHAAGACRAGPAELVRGAGPNDKNPRAAGPGREALGRSRGGLTTKIHLVADRRCRPVTDILIPGQRGDCPQFIPLMSQVRIARIGTGRPRTRPGRAMGDKAYSSAANRAWLRRRRIHAVIPVKEDQKEHCRAAAAAAAARLPSTLRVTASATPSSAAFPSSSSSAPSPPASTSANASTGAPWTSPRSGSGYATPSMIYKTRPSAPRPRRGVALAAS